MHGTQTVWQKSGVGNTDWPLGWNSNMLYREQRKRSSLDCNSLRWQHRSAVGYEKHALAQSSQITGKSNSLTESVAHK